MRRKGRLLAALLAMLMLLTMLPVTSLAADTSWTDGTYTGTGTGYENGTITLSVTVSDGKISGITTVSQEKQSYWESYNVESLYQKIIDAQSTAVDAITDATYSSDGVKQAVNNALAKAVSGFTGGTGTQDDPYLISGANGLQYLQAQVAAGTTYAGEYIKLAQDIDLSEIASWTPIGTNKLLFTGTFDGAGHTISGLTITDNTLGYAGLFGGIGAGGSIKNLSLTGVNIKIENAGQAVYAAPLAAYMQNDSKGSTVSVIDNCTAEGSINVTTSEQLITAGGLVGMCNQRCAVTNCETDVDITVNSGSNITNAGGLVGVVSQNALVMNNAVHGTITATSMHKNPSVGGLTGSTVGILYNNYCDGTVTLTGAEGARAAGSLVGNMSAATYVDSCYYLSSDSLSFAGANSGSYNSETVLAKTAADLASEDFAELMHSNLSPTALDTMAANVTKSGVNVPAFTDATARVSGAFYDWELADSVVQLTDNLWSSKNVDTTIFESGTGTQTDPYIIKTAEQLRKFAASLSPNMDYSGVYIALGDNINVSGTEWTPIGGSDYLFNGSFDGAGYKITGLEIGSADAPKTLDSENLYIGLFGLLGKNARVSNVDLDVAIYTQVNGISCYVGGLVGYMEGNSSDYTGAIIDSCMVSGTISHTANLSSDNKVGNQFVGGFIGMQYKGSLINSSAEDLSLSCVVKGEALAEVGGLVGLNNRGLVANCYSLSDVYGSGCRENNAEGMAVVSTLVAVQAGNLVGCYGSGDTTTKEYSTYAGMVSGWVTGTGKSYTCWYDLDSAMTVNGQAIKPVESIGTKVTSGVNDEGEAYTGGLVDGMTGYNAAGYAAIADALNSNFSAYPTDIVTQYGLSASVLKSWTYDSTSGIVTFGDTCGTVTYVQPECEKVVAAEQTLQDGTWYGRDDDKGTVVKITVENGEITDTAVLSGESSGDAYEAALEKAKYKATYGDFSHYYAADTGKFAGGSGTQDDPYLIANEEQLRYLSSSINEDVSWRGVYFRQTADIALTSEWQPIGWALMGEVNGSMTQICAYPFRGNYDGGGYTISGLTIGTAEEPADMLTTGLFGLTTGTVSTNDALTGEEETVTLKGIHLEDVAIYASTRYQIYAGTLAGQMQNGFYVDDCSVTGVLSATTTESFCRAGGLMGGNLRGAVTNCWTDVDITATTDASRVYTGGLYGLDNRVTTLNCYTLGDVTGSATGSNKTSVGGIAGQAGGIHINCYTAGNVVSSSATSDVGGINGRSGGIAADYNCYYNSEAVQKQGDTTSSPNVGIGVSVNSLVENVEGKTAAELASDDFAALLNENIANNAAVLEAVNAYREANSLTQQNYYQGNELSAWALANGVVGFQTETVNPFADVDTNEWYGSAVLWALDNGITNGTTATTFSPSAACTRAQAITFLWRAAGSPEPKGTTTVFTDVAADDYCYRAILWATEQGITDGTSATTFSPNAACTRAQAVTFLWRANGKKTVSATNPFTDVPNSTWYTNAVLWAVANNITNGTSASTFSPDSICTRAHIVTFLYRAA